MPFWNKALVYTNTANTTIGTESTRDLSTVVYIPFVRDSQNYVNASVLIKMTVTDTSYRIICDWQYSEFGFEHSDTSWSARDIFAIFSMLDKSVFGHKKYWVKDGRIFGYPRETPLIVTEVPQAGRIGTENFNLECTPHTVCVTAEPSTNRVSTETVCTTSYTCALVWTGGGSGPGPLPPGGGGGTGQGPGEGGPVLPPNPCPVLPRGYITETTSNPCDTTTWEPIVELEADPEYTCPANFTFVSITTNNLWQEAQLTNIYCNLVYTANGTPIITMVRIPQLFFGMAYFNVEGNLVFSQNTAKSTAADALNEAEKEMRQRFSRYPTLTALQLQEYWVERTNYWMNFLTDNLNRGRATRQGSISPTNPVNPRPYAPCQ